jgi:small-conductance mechanosensitive channel
MRLSRLGVVMIALALAGCSARYGGEFGEPVPPGQTGLHASIGITGAAADVVAGGVLLGILAAGQAYAPEPPMKADRAINEQDCSKPIVNPTANLRCR